MKIKTMLCGMLLFSCALASDESKPPEKTIYVVCAATNIVISAHMEDGAFKDILIAEHHRHKEIALSLGAVKDEIARAAWDIKETYNSNNVSWNEITELGKKCSSIGIN